MTWWESSHGGKPVQGAFKILKRGIADSTEMRKGLGYTIAMAMAYSLGSLMVPILIQQILDKGLDDGFRPHYEYTWCAQAAEGVVLIYLAGAPPTVWVGRRGTPTPVEGAKRPRC